MTYSLNTGTDTESISYNISDDTVFNDLINRLSDNDDNEINPKDLRDAILSIFSNSVFKETTNGSKYYIGIDTNNPSDNDLEKKILLGKREISPVEDTFIPDLASSTASDIYFYNTKKNSLLDGETKISILSSDDPILFETSPYISSQYVSDINKLAFNFVNQNGNINLESTSDHISINSASFSTSASFSSYDLNGKILKYEEDKITLGDVEFLVSGLTSSSEINIYGDTFLNGYFLEFTDNRKVPIDLGSLVMGETFDSYPLSELVKRVIYEELPPSVTLNILPPYNLGFIEVGTIPNDLKLKYTIFKRSLPIVTTTLSNMIPTTLGPITGEPFQLITGTASGTITPAPAIIGTQSYTITSYDSSGKIGTNSVNAEVVFPFFYGIGVNNTTNYNMFFLNKLVVDKRDIEVKFTGSGNIYFMYPEEYGLLNSVLDELGNNIINDFDDGINTPISFNYTSPDGNWASINYYIYESISTYNLSTPTLFNFKF